MVVKGNRYLPRVLREGFNGFAQCLVGCELLLEGTALVVVATDDLDFEVGLYVLTEASQVGSEVVGLELGLEGIELGTCLLVASLEAGKLSQLCQRGGGAGAAGGDLRPRNLAHAAPGGAHLAEKAAGPFDPLWRHCR